MDFKLVLGSYLVPLAFNALITFMMVGWVYMYRMKPIIDKANAAIEVGSEAVKSGMSAMGQKSGQVRNQKAFDSEIAGGIVDQYPELEMVLEMLSPDLMDKVRENPAMALNFLQRYGPMLGINLGKGGAPAADTETYDL